MHLKLLCALVGALVTLGHANAQDLEAGKALARKCSVCHGKQGLSKDPEVPSLAGQPALYLEKSMNDFRTGVREDRRMTIMAKPLSDDDVKNLAKWYSSFKVTVTDPS
jgi:cytochrome c553